MLTGLDTEQRVDGATVLPAPHPPQRDRLGERPHPRQPDLGTRGATAPGLWEINTASHMDWPQQSRIIEIADNRDERCRSSPRSSTTPGPLRRRLSGPLGLAGCRGSSAMNAVGPGRHRSAVAARNTELVLATPPELRGPVACPRQHELVRAAASSAGPGSGLRR